MSRPFLLTVLITALLPALTGCRSWNVGSGFQNELPAEESLSEELLESLSTELNRDSWRRNASWSPQTQISTGQRASHHPAESRWLFGNHSIEKVLNQVDALSLGRSSTSSIDEKSHDNQSKNEESFSFPHLGTRYLDALAQRDELSGWNAAILLAQRDPQSAGRVAEVLEQLVTSPPYYDLETKQRVAGPKSVSRWEGEYQDRISKNTAQPQDADETKNDSDGEAADKEDPQKATPNLLSEKELARELARELANELGQPLSEKPSELRSVWNQIWKENPPETTEKKNSSIPRAISQSMRAAAAEAWCQVLAAGTADPLTGLAPAGRLLTRTESGDQPQDSATTRFLENSGHGFLPDTVRGELFLGIAHWISPGEIPSLDDVFWEIDEEERASIVLRKSAMEACLIYAHTLQNAKPSGSAQIATAYRDKPVEFDASLWPSSVLNLQFDPASSVRRMLGRWVALVGHPQALPVLESQLMDKEFKVRDAALLSLGILRTEEARVTLQNQAQRSEERVRAWAVRGLAHWGSAEIQPFLTDDSYYVRQAVAEELADHPDVPASLLIRKLLIDSNSQVQLAAVHSLRDWPDEFALPLLLHGLRDSSQATRMKCFSQLRKRTKSQLQFPIEAAYPQRAQAALQLSRELNLSSGHLEHILREGLRETRPQVSRLQVAEIKLQIQLLAEHPPHTRPFSDALARLKQLSATEVPTIEQILFEMSQPHPDIIYTELLPSLSPVYAALKEMKSSDIRERRRGAQALAQQGTKASLSKPVVKRLHGILTQEQDRLVWRYALLAVVEDATEESDQIALLALNHTWADIRILGCRYLARHGKPQYAVWILGLDLFYDSNKEVKLAAIEAAGLCRNPIVLDGLGQPISVDGIAPKPESEPSLGLRSLLSDSDQRVRFAATIGMSRLGDPQGTQELIRLSFYPDPGMRQQVVVQMGNTGRTLFVEHLIRLAWTESSLPVKRAILKSLNQLIPEENRPVGLADQAGSNDKIKQWVDWWRRQRLPDSPSVQPESIASD